MKLAITFFFLFSSICTFAQKNKIYSTKDGAIKGYDPVAYFIKGEAIQGNPSISLKWNDATWFFSSHGNKNAFASKPEKYAPQFGGYCSYAVSQGRTYSSSPEAWKIVSGKLYLNYSEKIKQKWEANQTKYIQQARANWPKVIE